MDRLYIRLQRPIPGVDHVKAVDAEQFADSHSWWDDAAEKLDVDRINDFYVYEGEYGKAFVTWYRASKGLDSLRAVLEYYQSGNGQIKDAQRQAVIDLLQKVESVLDDADLHEIQFCFVGNY